MEDHSIEQLEDIIRKARDTHSSGSDHEKALIELDIRKRRLEMGAFSEQKKFFQDTNRNLQGIQKSIAYLSRKPIRSIIIGALVAVLIGILINLGTDFIYWLVEKIAENQNM